jgi:hypothetical protein
MSGRRGEQTTSEHVGALLRECGADVREGNYGLATVEGRAGVLATVRVNLRDAQPDFVEAVFAELRARFAAASAGADELAACTGEASAGCSEADVPRLRLSPRLTRAEMRANPIQFLCPEARFLARGVSSLITSLGGIGKTRFILQMFRELSEGKPLFGCELLRPTRRMRCLYIGAEDRQPFFNYLALPLLADDTDTLPFDVVLLPEVSPGFTLTPATARQLATFLEEYRSEHGLDAVAIDPMLSLIGIHYADMMKNPVVSRAFFNDCVAPLLASQAFALVSANHDSKAGAAVTGSADQQNAARCVLQLSTEGPTQDGTTAIDAKRHKDNLGFRFTKLVLVRDPETLLLTWDPEQTTVAYGAPTATKDTAPPPQDGAAVRRYLARQAAQLIVTGAPEAKRAKRAVEDLLSAQASRDGLTKVKDTVRSFLNGCCEFERHQERRVWRLVLVGVRNPDAALDEHDDIIAGRAARPETPE